MSYADGTLCSLGGVDDITNRMGDMALRREALKHVVETVPCDADNQKAQVKEKLDSLADGTAFWKATINYQRGDILNNNQRPVPPLPEYLALGGGDASVDFIIPNILRRAVDVQRTAIHRGYADIDGKRFYYNIPPEHFARGWGGAAIWYNRIAQMNGALVGAAWNVPQPSRYPNVMELVQKELMKTNQNITPAEQFNPNFATGKGKINLPQSGQFEQAKVLNNIYQAARTAGEQQAHTLKSGNILTDFIKGLFGVDGLFNLRSEDNKGAHPLAQLVGVGKGLIEATIRNLAIGGLSALGGIAGVNSPLGGVGMAASGLMFSAATITLTAGFMLFYVIPFLPFLYFFFAMGTWVKGVFEAMVGVPLWALAHIRIDGNGLPGDAAANGYYMIFEIFLRPILILFGLMAAVTIFGAMAAVLHDIFDIVVTNLTGFNPSAEETAMDSLRSPVDQLFFTVMYAVILYIMAMSSFKLIDLIPKQILRWMGSNASTFADDQSDPAQNLMNYTAIAGSQITQQITGGLQQGAQALQSGAKAALQK
jgi:hypothetical protein